MLRPVLILLISLVWGISISNACTNLIITKGASADKSVMITYAADSHTRYGALAFYPAADHKPGDLCQIYHYENGKLLGTIPEVPHTFSVIQFMNEHQVAIGETTWGGLDSLLSQPGAILDYGSLMRIGLQRSKTAREMIKNITELVARYGYASTGESFSVSDASEAWILEMIGKGKYEKGAIWVARLIPDGYVSGHANQARITTFPFQKSNDWDNPRQTVFHSPDILSFSKKYGFYKGADESFSFSDVYNPLGFGGARFCDARVWSFFRRVSAELRLDQDFTDYACGKFQNNRVRKDKDANPNGYVSNRLPLWIKPDSAITLQQVMDAMRDHYEDTPLDMRNDNGAGPYKSPYRWRPMEFEVDGVKYLNERAIATQQTGYSFVAQSRSWLPSPIGGIYWFGVDDTGSTVYFPMYSGASKVPYSYAVGNGSMVSWSETSAFWTFNEMAHWAYSRYNVIHPEIETYQHELESRFQNEIMFIDQQAAALLKQNPLAAREYVTNYSVFTADKLVADWKAFYHYLFMKYMDGNVKISDNKMLKDNGNGKNIPLKPQQPGYGKDWEKVMVQGAGDRLKITGNSH